MKHLIIFLCILLAFPVVSAQQHLTLLAVSGQDENLVGGTADLYLETRPGTGRIFLETFPFTKVDTQMSARFANEIACDYIDANCNNLDFFYTLRSTSAIVAGPSAGAAMALVTLAELQGDTLDQEISITGTINSGGIIGPVGGLKEKIEAAGQFGLIKVLIPQGEILSHDNESINLQNLSEQANVQVGEVATLNQVYYEYTGKTLKQPKEFTISQEYTDTMKFLAQGLCDRNLELEQENTQNATQAQNLSAQGSQAFQQGQYYAAASYCYGSNVEYTRLQLQSQNLTKSQIEHYTKNIKKEIENINQNIDSYQIATITDLEAYMIVSERLDEATRHLQDIEENRSDDYIVQRLAFATERVSSAHSWSEFLGKPGREFTLDKQSLQESCILKLSEVQQRLQYIREVFPFPVDNIQRQYEEAKEESQKGNYELCLFKASKAKANLGLILGVLGVRQTHYQDLLNTKLDIVKNTIAEQTEDNSFPILGYSYYEYSNSLMGSSVNSALLYAEYALELGNLDLYFEKKEQQTVQVNLDKKLIIVLSLGILVGILATLTIRQRPKNNLHIKIK